MESEREQGDGGGGGGAGTAAGTGASTGRPSSERAYSTATGTDSQFIEPDSISTTDDENSADDGISTQSLTNSVWTFHKENGRTYHGYRAGTYHFPNDPTEADRLDFQHCLFDQLFKGRLHYAPLTTFRHVLDIGCGTGAWAIEMGDAYPNAIIEGTDLSPIQPTAVPENVQFIIDDAENPDWAVPPDHYDYIHTRELLGCFRDFRTIVAQGFRHTKPGGWMESQEAHTTVYSDDGTIPDDWAFKEWLQYVDDAAMAADRPLRIGNKLKKWYIEAGFVDVQEKVYKLPLNTWPRDPELKMLGRWWQENFLMGLQGFSLAYFSREFGWSKDEIEVYLVNVRKALMDRHVHAYQKMYIVWGRKPEAHEIRHPQSSNPETISHPSTLPGPSTLPDSSFASHPQSDPSTIPSQIPLPASPTQSQPPPQFQSQFPPPNSNNDNGQGGVPMEIPFDFTPAYPQPYPQPIH